MPHVTYALKTLKAVNVQPSLLKKVLKEEIAMSFLQF